MVFPIFKLVWFQYPLINYLGGVSSPSAVSWINLIKVVFSSRTKEQNCFKQSHNLVRAFRLNTATKRPLEFGLRRCWKIYVANLFLILYTQDLENIYEDKKLKPSLSSGFLKRSQKFEKISHLFWRYWGKVKTSVRFFCVAFSEFLNFIEWT